MKSKIGLTPERQSMLVAQLVGGHLTSKEIIEKAKEFSREVPRDSEMDDVITFFKRRSWLRGGMESNILSPNGSCISKDEYATLLSAGTLSPERNAYLRAFMDGWIQAKK